MKNNRGILSTLWLITLLTCIVASCPCSSADSTAAVPKSPLSLLDAIAIAKQNQGSIKSAIAGVQASEQRIQQQRTDMLPSISGNLSYSITGRRTRQSRGGFALSSDNDGIQPEVNLYYNVYDGGLTLARVRQAKAYLQSSEANLATIRNDLALLVANAFYNQLRSQNLLDLRQKQVSLSEEQLKSVDARIEVGSAAAADKALPLSELRNRQVDLIQAENDFNISANELRNVMGLTSGHPLILSEFSAQPQVQLTLDELRIRALGERPEVVNAQAASNAANEAIRIARIGRLPKFGASANYDITPRGHTQRDAWEVGAVISMPIFDSGLTRAQEGEAKANAVAAQVRLEQIIKDVGADVTTAYNNLLSANERMTASDAALEAAQVNLQQTTERFNLGANGVSVVELIQAQVQFATAGNNSIQAKFDALLARVELDRAVGSFR